MSHLLQPAALGDSIPLRTRICMSSLTRNRCIDNNKPTESSARHYATRAKDGTGLIITEGIFIYLQGTDWIHTPVLFNDEHAQAWKKVTDAVHQEGGKIVAQAWHAGKASRQPSHQRRCALSFQRTGRCQNENMPMLKENDYPVLAPSNIPSSGGKYRLIEGKPVRGHGYPHHECTKKLT